MPPADWPGREIAAPDGTPYGRLDDLFVGRRSGAPEFGIVTVDDRQVAVPLDGARLLGDRVVLPLDPDRVRAAPAVRERVESIPPEAGARVRAFFGLADAPTTPMDPVRAPAGDEPVEVVRHEERAEVRTEMQPAERVRLRKRVITEEATITVLLRREELVLEREPIAEEDRGLVEPCGTLGEGEDLVVVLHAEEPVVSTRTVPVERIRLRRDVTTEEAVVRTPVSREEVDVDTVPTTTEEHPA